MTNEDQKNQNEEMSEDNLMAELDEFNEGSSPEASESGEQAETAPPDDKKAEEVQESQSDEKVDKEEPEKESEIEQWLIENKFKNDEEGVQKLADAYKQLQSKSDKDRNEWSGQKEKFDKLSLIHI